MKKTFTLFSVMLISITILAQLPDEKCNTLWRQANYGTCIGDNAMVVADLDGDGQDEVIADSGSGFWYILKSNESTGFYNTYWASTYYKEGYLLSAIAVADCDYDGQTEVIAGFSNGLVKMYDGRTMNFEYQFLSGAATRVNAILFADADNDQQSELVIVTSYSTQLYQHTGYQFENEFQTGATSIACGDVCEGDGVELAYSNGKLMRIQNGVMTEVWSFIIEASALFDVKMANCDDDGFMEIICAEPTRISVYDADTKLMKWEHLFYNYVSTYPVDLNNDGKSEILTGVDYVDNLDCLNPDDGTINWTYSVPRGICGLAAGNLDNDPDIEMMFSTTCRDYSSYISVINTVTKEQEWKSLSMDPYFTEVNVTDVDDDGDYEIITIAEKSDFGYGGGIMTVFDAETRDPEWQCAPDFFSNSGVTGLHGFETGDIDDDGILEIIVVGQDNWKPTIWIVNGTTHQLKQKKSFTETSDFIHFALEDFDADGEPEFVILGYYLTVLDARDLSVEYVESLPSGRSNGNRWMRVGNVDNDPAKEAVISGYPSRIIDGITHQGWTTMESTSIDLYDMDGDGILEILAGNSAGRISVINGISQAVTDLPFASGDNVHGVRAADIIGDSSPEFVFVSTGSVYMANMSGILFWTPPLTHNYSNSDFDDNIEISDYNNDGKKEIFLAGFYQVAEIDYSCYLCPEFVATILEQTDDVTASTVCEGSCTLEVAGGTPPFICYHNEQLLAEGLIVTGLCAGSYNITVKDASGCFTEVTVEIGSDISLPENNDKNPFIVYPVPASDNCIIQINDETMISGSASAFADLRDVTGMVVKKINLTSHRTTLEVSGLTPGIYTLTLVKGNDLSIRKIVISR